MWCTLNCRERTVHVCWIWRSDKHTSASLWALTSKKKLITVTVEVFRFIRGKKHHGEVKMFLPGQDVFKKTPKVRHTLWAALGDAGKEQEETSNRTWEGAALCHRSLGDIFSTHFQKTPKPCLKWVFPHQLCEVHVELRTVTQGHETFPLPPNFMLIKSSGSRCLWLRSPHLSKQLVPQLHQLGFSWQNNREKRGLLTLTRGR